MQISTKRRNILVFVLLWVILFILYLPTAKAGFIEDFLGWVTNVTTMKFWDYVNRAESHIASLYQFTQIITYVCYQLFGKSYWAWHLFFITLQAVNCFLLYLLFKRILEDAAIKNAFLLSLGGVLIYTVCPHISEVIVWEPSYHYLQGFFLILVVLLCTHKFIQTEKIKYAIYAGIVYFLSTFSLEIFYLTPWLVFSLALYYRLGLHYRPVLFKKAILFFVLPQLVFFFFHLFLLQRVYHIPFAHIGNNAIQPPIAYLRKPPKYFYHVLVFGRFFETFKIKVYDFFDTVKALVAFYTVLGAMCISILIWFNKMGAKMKAASLFFVWTMLSMALITPLWWQDFFLICYDRYTYVFDAFLYMMIVLVASALGLRWIGCILWGLYIAANIYYTEKVNWHWKKSAAMMQHFLDTFPDTSKTVLCLNLPECLDGAPMIGAQPEGGLKIMYDLLQPQKLNNEVYDVMCYNLIKPEDGVHVNVINDSTVRVTLNRWGTWWQYQHLGGHNYENNDFKVNMTDVGHEYFITLKHPADNFVILYINNEQWHAVDWNKKNIDQY